MLLPSFNAGSCLLCPTRLAGPILRHHMQVPERDAPRASRLLSNQPTTGIMLLSSFTGIGPITESRCDEKTRWNPQVDKSPSDTDADHSITSRHHMAHSPSSLSTQSCEPGLYSLVLFWASMPLSTVVSTARTQGCKIRVRIDQTQE
jgi:hypothetical protein